MRFAYPVDIERDTDGATVIVADFPEAITEGDGIEAALAAAADALDLAIATRIDRGEDIPSPSPDDGRVHVAPSTLIAAKAALHIAIRDAGITNAELARRLGVSETVVRRLRDPAHASRIDAMDAALAALGQKIEIGMTRAA